MKRMLHRPAAHVVCWYLVFTLSGAFMLPSAAEAAFVSPSGQLLSAADTDVLESARTALEKGLLTEKLTAAGLSPEEITQRLDSLTPDERQAVIDDVEQIQAGGNGIVTVLLVVLLVVLIIKLLDKEIVIK